MEYPIIDTLTNAYIRNGWTGLDLTYGKNLLEIIRVGTIVDHGVTYTINSDKSILINGTASGNSILILNENTNWIQPNTRYTLSGSDSGSRDNTYRLQWNVNGTTGPKSYMGLSQSYTTPNTINDSIVYIVVLSGNTVNNALFYPQIELGNTATPYEPYKPPTTDIFARTRLPLIRYFPHPVIDSLQRASDGTMTADDVHVLRHYLTKFGIGNIELGRFHAINPNVSNDIKEIDLEPIPIDKPIKEKKTGEEDLNVKTE